MRKEHVKYDPKLLESLMEALSLVKEEKRLEYIDSLFIDVEQTIGSARHYAETTNVDYGTALSRVIETKSPRPIGSFCKDGC